MAGLILRSRSRIYQGHDWIYPADVVKAFGSPKDGDVVMLRGPGDQTLGSAIYNSQSAIVARRFCRQKQALDLEFFQKRVQLALQYRARHSIDPRLCRVVWSEGDGLPGLIVDRYGDHLVVQTLTLGMDLRRDLIVQALVAELAPASIVERNDSAARTSEGLELRTGMLHGSEPPPFVVEAGGISFEVDLLRGQKTGLYLDQVGSYRAVAAFARGRTVLDCFSNAGGFALACAKAGAASVDAIEISSSCVAQIKANAGRNGVSIHAHEGNVFGMLREFEKQGRTFDLVVLDPPSFTRTREKRDEAKRGYKEIHLRALRMLNPNGLLATFCCSHHISAVAYRDIINEAAVDCRKTLRQLAQLSQGLDHPIISAIPETEYLKGFLFELAPNR